MSRSSSSMLPIGATVATTTAALNETAKMTTKTTTSVIKRTEADSAKSMQIAATATTTTIKPIPKLRHMTSKSNNHRHGSKTKQNNSKHLPKSDN